jgi:hypothetical protein
MNLKTLLGQLSEGLKPEEKFGFEYLFMLNVTTQMGPSILLVDLDARDIKLLINSIREGIKVTESVKPMVNVFFKEDEIQLYKLLNDQDRCHRIILGNCAYLIDECKTA